MTVTSGFVTTPTQAVTGTLKRSVSDQFRRLLPAITPFLSVVKGVQLDQFGQPSYSAGIVEKEAVETMKHEWFTWTAIDQYFTAAASTSGGSVYLASAALASSFLERDGIYNETQGCYGIVTRINSTVLSVTTIGSTTWAASPGDRLCMVANMYEEGSSVATSRTVEPSQNVNYCQTFRYPISIAETALNSPHYGPKLLERYMTDNTAFALENVERLFWLGEAAASGEVTSTTPYTSPGTAVSMYTMRGILSWSSATPLNLGGPMTWDRWNKDFLASIPKTQGSKNRLLLFCGRKIYGDLQNMALQKFVQYNDGNGKKPDEFGVNPQSYFCGPYSIEPVMHNLFDDTGMDSTAVVVDPKDLVYVYKKGLDMRPVENIQLPATMGTTRELRGTVSLKVWSGGANVLKITNWTA